jgi:hypothetical protein
MDDVDPYAIQNSCCVKEHNEYESFIVGYTPSASRLFKTEIFKVYQQTTLGLIESFYRRGDNGWYHVHLKELDCDRKEDDTVLLSLLNKAYNSYISWIIEQELLGEQETKQPS